MYFLLKTFCIRVKLEVNFAYKYLPLTGLATKLMGLKNSYLTLARNLLRIHFGQNYPMFFIALGINFANNIFTIFLKKLERFKTS